MNTLLQPQPGTANPAWNCWGNDQKLLALYQKRCRQEVVEMTCAQQAAQILHPICQPGDTVLDAGCGGGYYYHSFQKQHIPMEYYGLDYTPQMITLAQQEIPLPPHRFQLGCIEDLDHSFDHILCFNVLTYAPHYAQCLERLLRCTKKTLLIRESLHQNLIIRYQPDPYIDPDKVGIRAYANTYPQQEVIQLMEAEGFEVSPILDERTQNQVEMVIDIPHYWKILLATRKV
jgi:ubiquinone/menaquinone biosynthesis C-methylase UbiE